ncbi:Tim44 domain-containing protein [Halovulum dunhuangense]|uniref:Tim44 domain-containing protein n=1 Tax=Halovulum dunhuangense TaxID=1505036 RepID=A0A849KYZ7_9RHOB|nr:Tim44/TimA family putative adaptor protein [Halovulum dunhuangense]NNU79102.1 Tim44 domain-containing protein [Halovulum dunhuangense]
MGSQLIQILVLAGVALFLVLRLRDVLGTRDGFEGPVGPKKQPPVESSSRSFEVIDGGTKDRDIADHVDPESPVAEALLKMKRAEPGFSVSEFAHGARQAYEMIVMAYENGELDTLQQFLAPEVYDGFSAAVFARADKGYTVDANFVGVREVKIVDASFDEETREGDITLRFVGELTSVVRNPDGEIVEGNPQEIKRQKDVWTFSRVMGSENPNWLLVATGG